MKKLLLCTALALTAAVSYGQGTVNFSDATSSWSSTAGTYLLRWDASAALFNAQLTAGGLVTSNYAGLNLSGLRAELLYGAATVNDVTALKDVTGGLAPFRGTTSVNAGSWLGGTRTLNGANGSIAAGTPANMAIIVFDSTLAPDGLTAMAGVGKTYTGLFGYSGIFSYTCPTGTPAPSALLPVFTPFTVGFTPVPEPTTLALAGLGVAGLMIFRRRK